MTATRTIFMGTPDFAVPSLLALADSPAFEVVAVLTQPDRPAGRGQRTAASPVKRAAEERSLPLYQPRSLRNQEALARLSEYRPDLIVVVAFGQILPPAVLGLPSHGCLNVHASLLPRWRGAAPIAAAILHGDERTGVTVMQMDVGLDTGPIVAQMEEPIRPDDTRATLGERLAHLGAALLLETLPRYLSGDLTPTPQPEEGVTYAPQLRKEDGRLDWTRPATALDRQVRAFDPWPGAFTTWRGRRLRIWRATPRPDVPVTGATGMVVSLRDGVGVVTGAGVLRLDEVQLAGKRRMPAVDFARGQRDFVGSVLG